MMRTFIYSMAEFCPLDLELFGPILGIDDDLRHLQTSQLRLLRDADGGNTR